MKVSTGFGPVRDPVGPDGDEWGFRNGSSYPLTERVMSVGRAGKRYPRSPGGKGEGPEVEWWGGRCVRMGLSRDGGVSGNNSTFP